MVRIAIISALCVAVSASASAQTMSPGQSARQAKRMRIAGLALIGIGAGSFATGAVLTGVGVSENSDASCSASPQVVGCGSRSINGEMIAGWAGMAVGLVSLSIGIPLYLIGRHRQLQIHASAMSSSALR